MKNKHLTKRILAIPCALAIIATMGVSTAYAAGKSTASSAKPTTVSATNKTRKAADTKPKKELTDAQKAEMKTKMQERLKKELADGKITKAQYNEQLKVIAEGKMPKMEGKCVKPAKTQ